jgi:hypothetical protein
MMVGQGFSLTPISREVNMGCPALDESRWDTDNTDAERTTGSPDSERPVKLVSEKPVSDNGLRKPGRFAAPRRVIPRNLIAPSEPRLSLFPNICRRPEESGIPDIR